MYDRYETLRRKTAVTLQQHSFSLSDFIFPTELSTTRFCRSGRNELYIAPGTASNGELDHKICYLAY
jgi:hypothetical protein